MDNKKNVKNYASSNLEQIKPKLIKRDIKIVSNKKENIIPSVFNINNKPAIKNSSQNIHVSNPKNQNKKSLIKNREIYSTRGRKNVNNPKKKPRKFKDIDEIVLLLQKHIRKYLERIHNDPKLQMIRMLKEKKKNLFENYNITKNPNLINEFKKEQEEKNKNDENENIKDKNEDNIENNINNNFEKVDMAINIEEKKENENQIENIKLINTKKTEPGLYTLHSLSEEFNTLEKRTLSKKDDLINIEEIKNEEANQKNEYLAEYIKELKEYYTRHLSDSYQNFRTCLNKLEELIKKSGNNKITASMLKEIIDDSIFYEREKQIMNFIKEIKETQTQKEKIKIELKQNEINNLTKKLETQLNKKKNYKKISRELTVTLDKKNNEINEYTKKVSILEQEKNESGKLLQKKREELQKLKNDFTKVENEKIELEIKYKNLLEEHTSLEKINKNYENNKKLLYQGLEEEKKKLIDNIIKEINANWSKKIREKITEIKNIKKLISLIKTSSLQILFSRHKDVLI